MNMVLIIVYFCILSCICFHCCDGIRFNRFTRQNRGGAATAAAAVDDDDDDDDDDIFGFNTKQQQHKESYEIIVSTMYGSSFLDKKKKLTCHWNDSISDLKVQLSKKFAGSPAVSLQHLYFNNQLLKDDMLIANISTSAMPVLPLQLDMMSGTSVYSKTLSVRQGLEAYVATIVQHAYLSSELQAAYGINLNGNETDTRTMQTPYYQQLFHAVNRSVYEQYADDIAQALEDEKEPEVINDDTAAWRNASAVRVNPLAATIAKEFDLNWRGLRSFLYYSAVLSIFAMFGTSASWNTQIILSIIPMMWMSKLRQLRLLWKIMMYTVLPIAYKQDFLLPLLPAPLQVIAEYSAKKGSDNDVDDKEEGEGNEVINVAQLRETVKAWGKKMLAKRHNLRKALFETANRMTPAQFGRSQSRADDEYDDDEEEDDDDDYDYYEEDDYDDTDE